MRTTPNAIDPLKPANQTILAYGPRGMMVAIVSAGEGDFYEYEKFWKRD
jgi:hypothetical protein